MLTKAGMLTVCRRIKTLLECVREINMSHLLHSVRIEALVEFEKYYFWNACKETGDAGF
ncbi:uncharacterized protein PHALS_10631 [Plasmopara halstedii]|uniref:Uncharacterized protein n=1 Tax=Plasmopara halstedii TaxID=4781 RepID=A0A0P1AHX8_PLAHL|nr:uncharacterized protein PHALS_10631 [Plasmopara halstedii]CEG40432.1 hypothetical protein PHALS_10631 [Plasmopara halstedii]|eukprot:XP_024576801.1 hypothetical protein PHALS_10631 [Plasmopara halstedii]